MSWLVVYWLLNNCKSPYDLQFELLCIELMGEMNESIHF
jgi:hypothetical protein